VKLLIMQFSPTSCYFISHWSKNTPQITLTRLKLGVLKAVFVKILKSK
jgi:hypothetical protein